ncbi:MAG TPA: hypothetical protein VMI30_03520 [Stellaceae bacterium]|nr:hypothetical protein [Stellaceae bacterium]
MMDSPLPGDEPAAAIEFIGFDNASAGETVAVARDGGAPVLIAPKKSRAHVAAKPRKRTHPVRVIFDEDELRKLTLQAGAAEISLSEFIRRRALHEPRARSRQVAPPAADLFGRDAPNGKALELTVVRLTAPLSADLEQRISAYFAPSNSLSQGPFREPTRLAPLPARPNLFARFGQLVTDVAALRWLGHRATPPART